MPDYKAQQLSTEELRETRESCRERAGELNAAAQEAAERGEYGMQDLLELRRDDVIRGAIRAKAELRRRGELHTTEEADA